MLVRVGFKPSEIRCHRHKFGLNTFAVCRVADRSEPRLDERLHPRLPGRDPRDRAGARPRRRSTASPPAWPRCASAAAGCSSSASAAPPATPSTRSTTSARSAASRPTARPTTSASSPRGSTTRAGTRRFVGLAARCRASAPTTPCSCSPSAAATPSATSRANLVRAARPGPEVGATIYGIVGRDGGYTAAVGDAVVVIPPAVPRPHHAPHRGPLRRRVAPAGVPPRAPAGDDQVGRIGVSGSPYRRVTDRRRRRLHRQPPGGRCSGAGDDVEDVIVYDNFSSGRRWHLDPVADDPRLRVVEGEVDDLAAPHRRHGRRHRRRAPRLQPRHRPGHDRADHRLRRGHALTNSVVEAARRASVGSCSTRRAAASTATWARSRRPRTSRCSSRSRPTARASSPARR